MPESAFIVRVPEAEACVCNLRERYDASARLGVPAHITVLVPFMSPELITSSVTRKVQSALSQVKTFAFSLVGVARFPATTYLAPKPAEPFIALTEALVASFPQFPPFSGAHETVIPHLTVANGSAREAELVAVELVSLFKLRGPIHSVCSSVSLFENSSGRWKEMNEFTLPPDA